MIRILIFDDNPDFVDGISGLVAEAEGMELVGAYKNCKNVVRNVQHHQPDVVLMDIDMPVENGLQGLRTLRDAGLEVLVLMLTVFDDNERVFQSICFGANGYLLKHTPRNRSCMPFEKLIPAELP